MFSYRAFCKYCLVGAITAMAATPALAASFAFYSLPQPVHHGNVTYITGGIGQSEQNSLRSQAGNYNLLITDANKQGQFTADNAFTITNKAGNEMISVVNSGPLFYAKLPPGQYKVTARNGDQRQVEKVNITPHHEDNLHLIWNVG